jgi:hypothetical protein
MSAINDGGYIILISGPLQHHTRPDLLRLHQLEHANIIILKRNGPASVFESFFPSGCFNDPIQGYKLSYNQFHHALSF